VPPSDWATWEMCCPASDGVVADSLAEVVRVRGETWEMSRDARTRRVKEFADILAEWYGFAQNVLFEL